MSLTASIMPSQNDVPETYVAKDQCKLEKPMFNGETQYDQDENKRLPVFGTSDTP
jgi:hypothetical protein